MIKTINFQLKSTAHLPWRMMTYKALNTFIDDLFAFIIKMPTLYRLGKISKILKISNFLISNTPIGLPIKIHQSVFKEHYETI